MGGRFEGPHTGESQLGLGLWYCVTLRNLYRGFGCSFEDV